MMQVIPAIDLRSGKVVRLAQGDYRRETRYAFDAVILAEEYARAGAAWLHLVDLDGARAGAFGSLQAVQEIAATTGMQVQAGGGMRSEADVERLLHAGAARVVVGSVAVMDPAMVERWIGRFGGERICIALDVRPDHDSGWALPVHGWTDATSRTLDELAPAYAAAGARHLLCTDISCDGMLGGPNVQLYEHVARVAPAMSVQASGGVRNADDLRALSAAGATAAVIGRSLLEGRARLADLLAC
jgi:phosphoribosylformimino-5-aminoimidazole carboxamide ribotide isomerase